MSGGHLDYAASRLNMIMENVAVDESYQKHFPLIVAIYKALADPLSQMEHNMDWAISGDTDIKNVNEKELAGKVLDALMKVLPDEWFPRGKWATIQAIEARVEQKP